MMKNKYCIENVEIIRKYFIHIHKGIGYKKSTTNSKIRDVVEYERSLNGLDLRKLTEQIAIDYQNSLRAKKWHGKEISGQGGETVSEMRRRAGARVKWASSEAASWGCVSTTRSRAAQTGPS